WNRAQLDPVGRGGQRRRLAVGREQQVEALELGDGLAGSRLDDAAAATRLEGQAAAVGGETEPRHAAVQIVPLADLLPRGGVPQADDAVAAARQPLAVRGEGELVEPRAESVRQAADFLARSEIH